MTRRWSVRLWPKGRSKGVLIGVASSKSAATGRFRTLLELEDAIVVGKVVGALPELDARNKPGIIEAGCCTMTIGAGSVEVEGMSTCG